VALGEEEKPQKVSPEIGRFTIVVSPSTSSRPGLFLIDTTTGQTWELTRFTDTWTQPELWAPMSKYDNTQDMLNFLRAMDDIGKKRSSTVKPNQ
jgi:hypothetical protein